jgi:proteasome accessory factor B
MAEPEAIALQRFLRVVQLLEKTRTGLTVYELAELEEVHVKTIRRTLQAMQAAEVRGLHTIKGEKGKKRWKIDAKAGEIRFDYDELLSLYLGRQMMHPLAGTPLFAGIHSLMRKLESQLFHESEHLQQRFPEYFHLRRFGQSDYSAKGELISTLFAAIRERRVVQIQYQKPGSTAPDRYQLHPYGLFYHSGSVYLAAWSPASDGMRHFKLDRIMGGWAENQHFQLPPSFRLEAYLAGSFGAFTPSGKPTTVRIWFNALAASHVRESQWHPDQVIHANPDGTLILEVRLRNLEEIKNWVLSFGSRAKVLAPKELKERIRVELSETQKLYDED